MFTFADASPYSQDTPRGIEFVPIKEGCFLMGHNQVVQPAPGIIPEGPRIDESPQHKVCIKDFWLGAHEVTWTQWHIVMGGEPPTQEQLNHPVARVNGDQLQQFIEQLNNPESPYRYRLPTEAEWEYACRAGQHDEGSNFHSMDRWRALKDNVWFKDPVYPDPTSQEVGLKPANPWGLYDMLGNVWEWTQDEYAEAGYSLHAELNPRVDNGGNRRVIRGASYKSERFQVRCGARAYTLPNDPLPTVGFRLVKENKVTINE